MRNMRQQGTSREATSFRRNEKFSIITSFELPKKSTRLHTNRTPGLTPRRSPGRIQRKVLLLIIVKIKNAQNLKLETMEKACTHVASTCEKFDSRGHQGRPLLVGATLSTTLCVNSDKDCCLQTRFVTWVSMLVLLLLPLELPKWKFLDSYVFLLAEKKYKATSKQNSRFNAPSVTRANTMKSAATHNCKNKKIPKN